jgi:hypothetical protein
MVSVASAQTSPNQSTKEEVATVANSSPSNVAASNVPAFKDYRGVAIGMTAAEVRAKLDHLKKGDGQDFLVFSEHGGAYYCSALTKSSHGKLLSEAKCSFRPQTLCSVEGSFLLCRSEVISAVQETARVPTA